MSNKVKNSEVFPDPSDQHGELITEVLDRTSERFQEDPDTQEVMDQFARGHITAEGLAERLTFLRLIAYQIALDKVYSAKVERDSMSVKESKERDGAA